MVKDQLSVTAMPECEKHKSVREHTPNAREIALSVLDRLERQSSLTLRTVLSDALRLGSDRRDIALATELIYGILRHRLYLDYYISQFTRFPLQKSPDTTVNILRIGAYQILFLSKVPDYAIVNESVALARKVSNERNARFVNALLRALIAKHNDVALPEKNNEYRTFLSIYHSHPLWIVDLFLHLFGKERVESVLKADNESAMMDLRVNTLKTTPDEVRDILKEQECEEVGSGAYCPETLRIKPLSGIGQQAFFRKGLVYIQDEASQIVSHLLAPREDEVILDYCGTPGGKTTHIAQLQHDRGTLIAVAEDETGARKISENCDRLGVHSVRIVYPLSDVEKALKRKKVDKILVDAPCSALGTIRRHPDVKWNKTPKDIDKLAHTQIRILSDAVKYLKPGGILVYSTCTLTREENEQVIETFLSEHPGFSLGKSPDSLPRSMEGLFTSEGYMKTYPHTHHIDGFFAAILNA